MTTKAMGWRALALVVAGVLALSGCGDDGDGDGEETGSGSTTTEEATTTTEGSTTTSADEPDDGGVDDAPEAEIDPWDRNAAEFRADVGRRLRFECPGGGELDTAWGTDVYTDDSSVCTAAVHAGLITVDDGGDVVIEMAAGEDEYEGSERNGVTSLPYGAWGGSFTFPED
jgi:hypothetical protein